MSIDDESYFDLKDDITPGSIGFYKKSVPSAGDVPEEVQFRTKAKYPEKLLVRIKISEKGVNETFCIPKKALLTGSMYRAHRFEVHSKIVLYTLNGA